RNVKGPHRQTLELTPVLRTVARDDHLLAVQRSPKAFGDLPNGCHCLKEVNVVDVEGDPPRSYRILNLRRYTVGRRDGREKLLAIAPEMKAGQIGIWFKTYFRRFFDHAYRRRDCRNAVAERIPNPLLRKLIGWIELERGAKVCQRLDLLARLKFHVAAFD